MATEIVYQSDLSGERLAVEVPLSSTRELSEYRDDLDLPEFLVTDDTQVARFLGIAWAAQNAKMIADEDPSIGRQDSPIRLVAFGSVAVRLISRSANLPGPFLRTLGDLDLVTARSDAPRLVKLLVALDRNLGSRFWHAVTKSDEMFNALRRGRRYRVHGVEENSAGKVEGSVLDLVTDEIQFCHTIPVDDALANPGSYRHTINAVNLLLTKLQAIQKIDSSGLDSKFEYRVVGRLGDQLLIGPEAKDLTDVSALLLDFDELEESGLFSRDQFAKRVSSDWGLAKTVALNLGRPQMFEAVLREKGADETTISIVLGKVEELEALVNDPRNKARKPRMKFSKTWWEPVEDHEHD